MEIKFELTEAQSKALQEVMDKSNLKGQPPDDAAKKMFLGSLIQAKQALVADELGKQEV
jgi:hypothetical protein